VPTARQTLHALRDVARTDGVAVRVDGACMHPVLEDGTVVEVRAARFYWPGDIVAFAGPAGGLTVHRVIGFGPAAWTRPWGAWAVWTQADGAAVPDAPVALDRLLGRVAGSPAAGARARAALRLLAHLLRRAGARVRSTPRPANPA